MLERLDLTWFGVIHTVISIVAVAAGVVAVVRFREITARQTVGKVFIVMTALTCLTGLGIYRHGGFGNPHVLAIITLVTLAVSLFLIRKQPANGRAAILAALGLSLALFFHTIPAFTETATRLPIGAPLVTEREGTVVKAAGAVFFGLFSVAAFFQLRYLRARSTAKNEE